MEIAITLLLTPTIKDRLSNLRGRLGTHGLIVFGAFAVAAGIAVSWSWLVAIGLAPLLLTVLPCVAMCALGLCSMSMGRKTCANDGAGEAKMPSSEENGSRALPPKHDEQFG